MIYIWHCSRRSCGAIVLKTKNPFLKSSKIYRCKRCNEKITSEELINANKRNIRKYLQENDKKISKKLKNML